MFLSIFFVFKTSWCKYKHLTLKQIKNMRKRSRTNSKTQNAQNETPTIEPQNKTYKKPKIKYDLDIKELDWTDKQKDFINICSQKYFRLMFVKGLAGTSKTLMSIYASLKLLKERRVSDIYYIRSAVESSHKSLGFLPGEIDDKLYYYTIPFLEKMEELLPTEDIKKLKKEDRVTAYPVNFARGMSWNEKSIVIDEAQNMTYDELITLITRLGEYSRCFVCADPLQSDLQENYKGGFEKLYKIFNDKESVNEGIYTFEFDKEDIVRSDLLRFIITKLDTKRNEHLSAQKNK